MLWRNIHLSLPTDLLVLSLYPTLNGILVNVRAVFTCMEPLSYSSPLPSTDSRRAVVIFWQKNVHNTG